MATLTQKPNVVVVGGSYVVCCHFPSLVNLSDSLHFMGQGAKLVDILAPQIHNTHNTILVEKNSHFQVSSTYTSLLKSSNLTLRQHLFAFPRMSVIPGFEHKAFIPYTNAFSVCPPGSTSVIIGAVSTILPDKVVLERTGSEIPYEYLVLATGTGAAGPLVHQTKAEGIKYYRSLQQQVERANDIVVIGGGASGVREYAFVFPVLSNALFAETAADLKDYAPSKNVTLIHSRPQLMNRFHPGLHSIVMDHFDTVGIKTVLGQRIKIPSGGFPIDGSKFEIELADGTKVSADCAVSSRFSFVRPVDSRTKYITAIIYRRHTTVRAPPVTIALFCRLGV